MVKRQIAAVGCMGQLRVLCVVLVDTILDLVAVVSDETLDWPGSGIAQGADGVTLDLLGELPQHVDLGVVSLANFHALERVGQPAGSLAARSALSAALVLVELAQPQDRLDDVGRIVHHDHRRCPQPALQLPQGVEVHQHILAELLGQQPHRRSSRDDGLEVVPPSDNSSAVPVDEFSQRNRHFLLDRAGVVDVPRNAEQLGAAVVGTAEGGEPAGASSHDGGADRHGFDVGDCCRTVEDSRIRGEGRF
jgi:hypothetical protein